ncbi:hypothetical protein R1flu_003567 [Riccia fluitans]|uniref:glutathione transferase n=1 Tax=Riccia fluitans TaxID=41844 RepID=A0ABD1YCE9_9MARC
MVVKVYGLPISTATRNVMTTLHEKGVEFELVIVDLKEKCQKRPEFLKLNPIGKVPVYQDEEVTLFESRAINRYIARKYEGQGTPLLGRTPTERAVVEQWMEVEGQYYFPSIWAINYQLYIRKMFWGEGPDLDIVAINEQKLTALLDVYESRLSESKYLAGDFFSLADLSHYGHTEYLMTKSGKSHLINSRPHVAAWWEDISSRSAWQKAKNYGSNPQSAPVTISDAPKKSTTHIGAWPGLTSGGSKMEAHSWGKTPPSISLMTS